MDSLFSEVKTLLLRNFKVKKQLINARCLLILKSQDDIDL